MAEITIEVTQDDIDKGCTGSAMRCPVYLAMRRAFPLPQFPELSVWSYGVSFLGKHVRDSYVPNDSWLYDGVVAHSPEVKAWIELFDTEKPRKVKPFSFALDVPDDLLAQVTG